MPRSICLPVLLLAFAVPASVPAQPSELAQQRAEWNRPMAPFRIIGNVYYVGTAGLGAYLIAGPRGHVLIDGGMEESAEPIAQSVRALGFRMEDIRFILNNHAHWDHAGGIAGLQRLSGAEVIASAADASDLEQGFNPYRDDTGRFPPVRVARRVGEGDTVALEGIRLTAHLTPGHTRGCTSWSLRTEQGGRGYDVLFACSLSVAGQPLAGDERYPEAAADFAATFDRLAAMHADVFLGFHDMHFGLDEKRRRLAAGDALAFVDPAEVRARVAAARAAFEQERARQRAALASD